jgi:hypothetical protein
MQTTIKAELKLIYNDTETEQCLLCAFRPSKCNVTGSKAMVSCLPGYYWVVDAVFYNHSPLGK